MKPVPSEDRIGRRPRRFVPLAWHMGGPQRIVLAFLPGGGPSSYPLKPFMVGAPGDPDAHLTYFESEREARASPQWRSP